MYFGVEISKRLNPPFLKIWKYFEYQIVGFRNIVKNTRRLGTFVGDAKAANNMMDGNYKNWNLDLILPNLDLDHISWDKFKEKI